MILRLKEYKMSSYEAREKYNHDNQKVQENFRLSSNF